MADTTPTQSKTCAECGATFHPTPRRSAKQWAKQQCCTPACANALRQRGHAPRIGDLSKQALGGKAAYRLEWGRRRALPYWAAWWVQQRYTEDSTELTRVLVGGPTCRVSQRPKARLFIGRTCQACGAMWVSYETMPDAPYCKRCNRARWRETHAKRAERYGLTFEVIDPVTIFERDGYRCQICGHKTMGKWPAKRSPTLDHIVPMARGGHHVPANLQTACRRCNEAKGAGSANDQLRLAV